MNEAFAESGHRIIPVKDGERFTRNNVEKGPIRAFRSTSRPNADDGEIVGPKVTFRRGFDSPPVNEASMLFTGICLMYNLLDVA